MENLEKRSEGYERWLRRPTILASNSTEKLRALEEFGFTDIHPSEVSVPESAEQLVADELKKMGGAPPNYYALHQGSDITRHIAAAKVRHVLEHSDAVTDQLVLAFDTAPIYYQTGPETDRPTPIHQEKPASLEELRASLYEMISRTAEGCTILNEKIERFQQTIVDPHIQDQVEGAEMIANHRWALSAGHIDIYSAAAASFPGNRESVAATSEHARLFSSAIDEARDDPRALELLANKVIDIMGTDALQISGGIDFSNSYVRDLLKITEERPLGNDEVASEGLYQTISTEALKELLIVDGRNGS